MAIDISLLPAPSVIETVSFEAILAERKDYFISLHPAEKQAEITALLELESEPIVKLLEENAYRETVLRTRYNDEAKALLLAFAKGADLDHIGVTYYEEERLLVTPEDNTVNPPIAAVWETDEEYKYRLSLKPSSYSVAGPLAAYKFHTLSATGMVRDAYPVSETSGNMTIYVLARNETGIPDEATLDVVDAALNDHEVRPMCDKVAPTAATIKTYTINVGLIAYTGAAGALAIPQAQINLEKLTANAYKLGYDITRSAINAEAKIAGIKDVIITSPAENIVCGPGEAAKCVGINVNLLGIES